MIAKGILSEDRDKCFQDKGTDSSFINTAIINQMLGLPEERILEASFNPSECATIQSKSEGIRK